MEKMIEIRRNRDAAQSEFGNGKSRGAEEARGKRVCVLDLGALGYSDGLLYAGSF